MQTRLLTLTLFMAGWAGAGCSRSNQPIHHSHTNVLMITCCTQRADHLGCYGYERKVSPNIDQLAAEGFRFEQVLAQAPWTKAGISAIITGMYPRSLNIEDPQNQENFRQLDDRFTTTAEIMKKHGYHTIGITANPNSNAAFKMDQGYDYYRDPLNLWQDGYAKDGVWTSRKVTDLLFEHLATLPKKEKFFAHLVFIDVHKPREHKMDTDADDQFQVPPKGKRAMRDIYDLHVSFTDESIGLLRAKVKEMGLDKDLLIIINADHGEGLKDHASYDSGHTRFVYNSTIWIPWIIHHPALKPAKPTYAPIVRQIDMLPTLLESLGIDAKPYYTNGCGIAGVSRWPSVARGQPTAPFDYGFVRTQFLGADRAAVLNNDFKLIINFDHEKTVKWRKVDDQPYYPPLYELYRWRDDRKEKENLYDNYPEVVDELKQAYRQWEEQFPACVQDDLIQLTEGELKDRIQAQLNAIGYVAEGDEDPGDDPTSDPDDDDKNDNEQD